MNKAKFKLVLLFTNYGPYHLARLNATAEYALSLNWEVIGFELAHQEAEYPWQIGTDQSSCPIISISEDSLLEETPPHKLWTQLILKLDQESPDAIAIAGYFHPAMLVTLAWSRWHRKVAILLSETTENDEPRHFWKEKIKSLIVNQYQAALVGGHPHKRYLVKLGMPQQAIFIGYDVVGNETFDPHKIRTLANPLNRPFFLAINRFIPKKNLPLLLAAYASYRQKSYFSPWDLVLCGDGEMRSQLEIQIQDLGIQQFVHLPGFLQQEQLLPYFAHAQCFIHASTTEQWGLVINEAMAAGLPVLVSNRCGCYENLIIESVNGYGFDPNHPEQITELMLKMSSDKIDLDSMGKASLDHIQNYSPNRFATQLVEAIKYVLNRQA